MGHHSADGLWVSNSPCGVERSLKQFSYANRLFVSNSPCGVESPFQVSPSREGSEFLIHRVELKALDVKVSPDAIVMLFLIHRVELKD